MRVGSGHEDVEKDLARLWPQVVVSSPSLHYQPKDECCNYDENKRTHDYNCSLLSLVLLLQAQVDSSVTSTTVESLTLFSLFFSVLDLLLELAKLRVCANPRVCVSLM